MWTTKDINNPDGSCTHPLIRTFDTKKEYHSNIRDASQIATLHHIPTYDNTGFCLDGSAPAFYYRAAAAAGRATNKYQIYFESGGFCFSYEQCSKRAQTAFGSSQSYKKYAWFNTEYLSTDKQMNNLSYDWNTIYIRSCDGMTYLANKQMINVFDKKRIHFEGFAILRNLMKYLFVDENEFDLKSATDVIVSGSSDGGMTILYHINYIWNTYIKRLKAQNDNFRFMVVIESGYFRIVHENTIKHLLWLYEKMDVMESLDAKCMQYYSNNDVCFVEDESGNCDREEKPFCLLLQYLMEFIDDDIKIFMIQSRFDFNYRNKNKQKRIEIYNKIGDEYTQYILNEYIASGHNMNRGAFITSCKHHCGEFNNIEIDGYIVSEAMFEFYYANKNKTDRNLWFQNYNYPCEHCCFLPSFADHDPAVVHGCELLSQ